MDIGFWVEPGMLAGEGAFVRHLVMGLKAEGQEITFITPHGTSLAELPVLGSRVLSYRWNRWERLPVLQKLRLNTLARQLNDNPPDVLVAWGSAEGGPAGALSVLSQMVPALPVVLWCWDASELFTPLARMPAVRHIVASSQMIADRVQAKSEPVAPKTSNGVGQAEGNQAWQRLAPVTVVHPGVYAEETIACFDVEGQMPCLVSLDPLSSRSAYEALLRACRRLVDRGQEFLLFAYDKGSAEYPIWRMAEEMQILEQLSFVPFQQEAEPLLLHGDLYIHVLPSSRVQYRCLEAMARGLAVVTCPNHSADHLIDGQTCRVVGPQTPEAWCEALEEMLKDRGKATALARRAQQYVREQHSMARTLEQFGSICRQAAGMAIPMGGR
jgi:glycosyltransferase involved in cell wall biosynthesis